MVSSRQLKHLKEGWVVAFQVETGLYTRDENTFIQVNQSVMDIAGYDAHELSTINLNNLIVGGHKLYRAGHHGFHCGIRRKDGDIIVVSIEEWDNELGFRKGTMRVAG